MPEAEIRNSVDQDAQIKLLREKIVQEDELLNSRVNIFLVLHGLLLTAVGQFKVPLGRNVIVLLGIFLTVVWFLCVVQSWKTNQRPTIAT